MAYEMKKKKRDPKCINPKLIIDIFNSLKIENQEKLNEAAKYFESQVQVCNNIKKIVTKPKQSGPNKQKKSNKDNKCKLSDLYRRQKHRALQEILIGPTLHCPISADKIEKYYADILMVKPQCNIDNIPMSLWPKNKPDDIANLTLTKEFTLKEVRSKLLSKIHNFLSSSRSPGLDRIKFDQLRFYDSDCSKMTSLFNACLKLQTVPEIWMEFYSVLVKKTNSNLDSDDAGSNNMDNKALLNIQNWYPVTMERTISKLFQSLIAVRLTAWANKTGRLSATQKGFLVYNAACESSFILQECKKFAEEEKKDLAIAWLDFENASESIPQSAILNALTKHSVPLSIIEIIRKIFEYSKTKFRVTDDSSDICFTKPISIFKGLPPGSPINPILLDLLIEPILRDLSNAVHDTFEIHKQRINHYAIPHELTLIADSSCKLQNLLILVEKNAKLLGLKFNIHKCSTYHYCGKERKVRSNNKFAFFGQKLSTLLQEKIEEFFGVKQSLSIGQNSCPSIPEMIKNIKAIDESSLKFYQKVESILMYIIPRVENCLRGLQGTETIAFGTEDKVTDSLKKADELLMDRFKCWLNLSKNASPRSIVYQVAGTKQSLKEDMDKLINDFSLLSTKQNVMDKVLTVKYNYLPFMDLFYIMKIVQAFKMLTSQDRIVKEVAFAALMAEVNNLIPNKMRIKVNEQHLVQYLSGDLHVINKKSNSLWCLVREASLRLKIKLQLKWKYNDRIQLVIRFGDVKRKKIFSGKDVNSMEEKLKIALVEYYIDQTMKMGSGPEDYLKAIT